MSEEKYWSRHYKNENKNENINIEPSPFAKWCYSRHGEEMARGILVDVGCGNGRDTFFFAEKGVKCIGIDLALPEIILKHENCIYARDNLGDLSSVKDPVSNPVSTVYSRFSIHSVDKKTASNFFKRVYEILRPSGLLMIEARSILDKLYGNGDPVSGENHAFVYGAGGGSEPHYRRFIDKVELKNELEEIGFKILYCHERSEWAKHNGDNPHVVRIVASRG